MAPSKKRPAPRALASRTVTVLDVYGSLLYAGARTLEARLPNPADAYVAAVVLRLRGRSHLGATAFTVLRNYADRLGERGGRLYLSGVDPNVVETFQRTGHLDEAGPLVMVPAGSRLGASTEAAFEEAQAWVAAHDRDADAGANDRGTPTDER